ncbi:MAG: hypothetical protein EOP09_15265, partial [Proteobacteria bacterium]
MRPFLFWIPVFAACAGILPIKAQAAEETKNYLAWCLDDNASDGIRATVDALKSLSEESDCEASSAALSAFDEFVLKYSKLSDLRPLGQFTNLKYLDLEGNDITDVSPLATLTNLRELTVSDNPLRDISPVTNLPALDMLIIWGTQIVDFSTVPDL